MKKIYLSTLLFTHLFKSQATDNQDSARFFNSKMGTLRAVHILLTVGNLIRDTILNPLKEEKIFWHFKAMVSFL